MVAGITERAVFDGFGRTATRSRGGPLLMIRNEDHADYRLRIAYAVPRRVGPAVVRNRLRRQLRAVVAELDHHGLFPVGTYMIVVGPQARGARFEQLREWLLEAIRRMPPSESIQINEAI